jgi:hypothetical protein
MLRPVTRARAERARGLVDRVRHISHPKLLKVMGTVSVGAQDYLASEYIAGASFVELRPALVAPSVKDLAAVVRVVRDVLLAASSGRRLFEGIYGHRVERCIYPDTIWIAEFGDAFLTELGVFEAMLTEEASGVRGIGATSAPTVPGQADNRAVGALLFDLLKERSGKAQPLLELPTKTAKALAHIVSQVVDTPDAEPAGSEGSSDTRIKSATQSYATPNDLAQALSNLPPGLEASGQDVNLVLSTLLGPVLALRRRKLALLECSSLVGGDSDETRFHRASGVNSSGEVQTLRPEAPAESGTHPSAAPPPAVPVFSAPILTVAEPSPPTPESTSKALAQPAPANDAPAHSGPFPTASPLEPEEATTAWLPAVGQARPIDEDATTIYVASKERPVEPSVIVQDQDATALYLRAKTDGVPGPHAIGRDEVTVLAQRLSQDPYYLKRRRGLRLVVSLVMLALASLVLTVLASRFHYLPF